MLEQGKETALVGLINEDMQTCILIFHRLSATFALSTLNFFFFFHMTEMSGIKGIT